MGTVYVYDDDVVVFEKAVVLVVVVTVDTVEVVLDVVDTVDDVVVEEVYVDVVLDTVLVVDVDEEFESVIGQGDEMLPTDVAAESLERLTAIATDLATAGREGKSIGAMFILGDHQEVIKRSKQLILNPFYGYFEEDRNILNPFMDETIKELALIDGAFIVKGNGVIESAGCLIQAKADEIDLPGGMGTRHAAAAAITQTTESLALVVSSSGQVTYFRKGRMFTLFDKSEGRSL